LDFRFYIRCVNYALYFQFQPNTACSRNKNTTVFLYVTRSLKHAATKRFVFRRIFGSQETKQNTAIKASRKKKLNYRAKVNIRKVAYYLVGKWRKSNLAELFQPNDDRKLQNVDTEIPGNYKFIT
jgi:hypothetical protein